jgi:hypothetical protein
MLTNQKINKGTLAVISGNSSEFSKRLAYHLTDELAKSSSFTLIKQEKVEDIFTKYQSDIIDFKLKNTKNLETPFISPSALSTLSAMNGKLQAKYIYLIWAEDVYLKTEQYNTSICILAFGRLIEYPENKVIAFTNQWPCYGISPLVSREKSIDINVKKIGQKIAQIISKTSE